ncbi:hypothetical protein IGI37_002766 [Enterococcus sp. AZ194]
MKTIKKYYRINKLHMFIRSLVILSILLVATEASCSLFAYEPVHPRMKVQ